MTDKAIYDFVQCQKRLLQREFDEEQEEPMSDNKVNRVNGESPQTAIRNLEVVDVSLGLVGRTVLTLKPITASIDPSYTGTSSCTADRAEPSKVKLNLTNVLPSHRLAVGDDVEILGKDFQRQNPSNKSSRGVIAGVVSAITDESISIVLYPQNNGSTQRAGQKDGTPDDPAADDIDDLCYSSPLTVLPRSSIQAHRKIMQSLDDLSTYGVGHEIAGSIIQAAFGEAFVQPTLIGDKPPEILPFNPNLDQSQKSAIEFVLSSQHPIALIRMLFDTL